MQLKIWGCRGSCPRRPDHGGLRRQHVVVEFSLDDGTVLVLDAGTGIRDLGDDLVERGVRRIHPADASAPRSRRGLRFFAPLFDPKVTIDVWGPPSTIGSLEDSIARTFSPPLFPIDLGVVPAQVAFHDAPRQPWKVESACHGGAGRPSRPDSGLSHRGRRIERRLPDHEPALTGIEERPSDWISGAAIAEGADVLLHDAQYFEDEYAERIGWGHSSVSDTIAYAKALRVGRLALPPRAAPLRRRSVGARGARRTSSRRTGPADARPRGHGRRVFLADVGEKPVTRRLTSVVAVVVLGEALIGEEVPVAGVEEELRALDRRVELAGRVEVSLEAHSSSSMMDLQRDALRPRAAELLREAA